MPPDAIIERIFSEKSDVWSFGIVLWEIFSLGATPFASVDVVKFSAQSFAEWLLEGHRMECPELTPPAMYDKPCYNQM